MQTAWSGLHYRFLCHFLKALFFIKIALKLSFFWKKNAKFSNAGGSTPITRASGGWGLCPQTPKHSPLLQISDYAWQLCTVYNYMRLGSLCFEQFFLDRSVSNLMVLIIDLCLMLNYFLCKKFSLHYALWEFDSISWYCTKLFIFQSIDCEQIFDATFDPPHHCKILRTPLMTTVRSVMYGDFEDPSCYRHC